MIAKKRTRYDKISFLTPAPEIELEFLIGKEEVTRCYSAHEGKLFFVYYTKHRRKVWTEYISHDGYPRLEHISMKRVLQILGAKETKELIENWNALKGMSPPPLD